MDASTKFTSIDEYHAAQSPAVREAIDSLRLAISQAAPEAEEIISYNMPAFKLNGVLVYYAAHKEHIGFYPGGAAVNIIFRDELTGYETSKGTVRFPLGSPMPIELVKRIVEFRVKQNLEKAAGKQRK